MWGRVCYVEMHLRASNTGTVFLVMILIVSVCTINDFLSTEITLEWYWQTIVDPIVEAFSILASFFESKETSWILWYSVCCLLTFCNSATN